MPAPRTRRNRPLPGRRAAPVLALSLVLGLGTASCVTQNKTTGEMVPRGEQRYPWDEVVKRAKKLEKGLPKAHVLMLMGSPAEKDDKGDTWIYLPERYAILIPAEALRLEFENSVLKDFGYRPIILGAQL